MPHVIEIVLFPEVLGRDVFGPMKVFHAASGILEQTRGIKQAYSFRFAAGLLLDGKRAG
ncbi:hypothetical protein SAMN02745216_04508 [Desulfatibacillum alkenivorans DSM 16219]|uniref:Uncharacterized protein n=1 Tax=Desulfatibacillum alkenivorans DSM 16219 TaxID=1121393 RepID=A0A1M6XCG4_9BACT|nr:hypothetical protein [Desulfatibacillum alkenivorans]SHL03588.1 hypothetical protein SAMN02745216_04508 [Desulfatibacillum alkenivorans DSM 16219]